MSTLQQLREQIIKLDEVLIKNLSERQTLCLQIGQIKSLQNLQVFDRAREYHLMELYGTLSNKYHLQEDFVKKLFKLIIEHSRKLQKCDMK